MILVTRINKVEQFYVNENLIEFIEETPDTIVSMESGKKVVVMEPAALLIERIIEQKRRILALRDPMSES
ncbi:MAG: flagellar FlbD family protein [Clostridiales bacterium]|nr:flagellar FlbD family protein [Clostridiales bacterium]